MSKIIQVINAMISNPSKITEVMPAANSPEYFFLYDNKYKWSIFYNDQQDVYSLYYYPGGDNLSQLAANSEWDTSIPMVKYSTTDTLSTKEARESFKELYGVVKEKLFGVDSAFDEIIRSSESF